MQNQTDIYALPDPVDDCIFGHKVEHLKAALSRITELDMQRIGELESFANSFKNARIRNGFTQGDVGYALGRRYGADFSQTTISRFEGCNLSFKNMNKLQPIFHEWITEAEKALMAGSTVSDIVEHGAAGLSNPTNANNNRKEFVLKKRKKRTNLDGQQTNVLEVVFRMDNRPSLPYMEQLAEELELEFEVVKIWFANRRQKMRRNKEVLEAPDLNNLEAVIVTEKPPKKRGRRPGLKSQKSKKAQESRDVFWRAEQSCSLDSSIFAEFFSTESLSSTQLDDHEDANLGAIESLSASDWGFSNV